MMEIDLMQIMYSHTEEPGIDFNPWSNDLENLRGTLGSPVILFKTSSLTENA